MKTMIEVYLHETIGLLDKDAILIDGSNRVDGHLQEHWYMDRVVTADCCFDGRYCAIAVTCYVGSCGACCGNGRIDCTAATPQADSGDIPSMGV